MARKKVFTPDAIEKAARLLEQRKSAVEQTHSARTAVERLAKQIGELRESGLGWEEIAEVLARADIDIGASTLRDYYQELARKQPKAKAKAAAPVANAPGSSGGKRSESGGSGAEAETGAKGKDGGATAAPATQTSGKPPQQPGSGSGKPLHAGLSDEA